MSAIYKVVAKAAGDESAPPALTSAKLDQKRAALFLQIAVDAQMLEQVEGLLDV